MTSFWVNFDAPRRDVPEHATEKARMTTTARVRPFRSFSMRMRRL
jgi:hypothetical protein